MRTTIPINPESKRPAVTWAWRTSGQSEPIWPGYDSGVLTGERSGIVIVDLDIKNGKDGPRALAQKLGVEINGHTGVDAFFELVKSGHLPPSETWQTTSGGLQVAYQWPGVRIKNSISRIAPGIDIRGDGGYAKIPPSKGYRYLYGEGVVAPMPEWLLEATRVTLAEGLARVAGGTANPSSEEGQAALARAADKLRGAEKGTHNQTAYNMARLVGGYIGSGALDFEEAYGVLASAMADWDTDRLEQHLLTVENGLADGEAVPIRVPVAEFPLFDGVAEPLPPINWVCEGLRLAGGGMPALFAGYGYTGKTAAAQSLVLSVLNGRDVWSRFPCRQGRVVHLDYEQGTRLTSERYQRLARAMGLDPGKATKDLALSVMPPTAITASGALDALTKLCEGAALLVIDSLSYSTDGVDENKANEIRAPFKLLTTLSARTGCCPIILHHTKKPPTVEGAEVDSKMTIRGSSAIFSSASTVFVFATKKGEITIENVKDRITGKDVPEFGISIEDVAIDGDASAGLAVRALDSLERSRVVSKREADRTRTAKQEILDFVRQNKGCIKEDVLKGIPRNRRDTLDLLKSMIGIDLQVEPRDKRDEIWIRP